MRADAQSIRRRDQIRHRRPVHLFSELSLRVLSKLRDEALDGFDGTKVTARPSAPPPPPLNHFQTGEIPAARIHRNVTNRFFAEATIPPNHIYEKSL